MYRIPVWPLSFVLCLSCPPPSLSAQWDRLGPDGGRIPALSAAPSNPRIVYAGNAFVYRSDDGGASWARTSDVFPISGPDVAPPFVRSIAVSPADPNRVAVGSPRGLYLTTDGGVTWKQAPGVTADIASVSFSMNGKQLLASSGNTMYRSQNAGDTWATLSVPTMCAMTWDPKVPAALVGLRAVPDGSGRQLYRSDDGGSWYAFSSFSGVPLNAVRPGLTGDAFYASSSDATAGGLWRVARNGVSSQVCAYPVAAQATTQVSPSCLLVARATGSPAVARTCDDGGYWDPLYVGFTARGALALTFGPDWTPLAGTERGGVMANDQSFVWHPSNTGLAAATVTGACQSPANPSVILAAATDGLYRSSNDGDSWTMCHGSLTRSILGVSPALAGRVWHTGAQGLEKSDDWGVMWQHFTTGLPATIDIARIVPHPTLENTVFIVTAGGAVYQNTTGNPNWVQRFAAWPSPPSSPPDLVISPVNGSTVYATRPDGIYRSTDGGAHWTLRTASVPAGAMLCAGRTSADILYRASTIGTTAYVTRSTDGGATWAVIRQETGASNSAFAASFLAIDPRQPNRFLLGTNRGLRISDDAGATWRVESIGTAGIFTMAWAPYGTAGDLLATGGAGLLRYRPPSRSSMSAPDAVRILALALSPTLPSQADLDFADLNDDGRITLADADLALRSATGP
ncbi:MAG TPA: hypothetical protein VGM51_10935 [Armatimonadota bacterium]|jgi:photosystem II stability/assembly factor-like uncharacterized protein